MRGAAQRIASDGADPLSYSVRTPENVTFEFEVAGLSSRFLAWGVDLGLWILGTVVIWMGFAMLSALTGGLGLAAGMVACFVFIYGYHVFFEYGKGGATPGKRLLGLQVISEDGLPIDFWQALLRNLLRAVDFLSPIYFLGATTAFFGRWNRRLGDLVAGTIVVRKRSAPKPSEVVAPADRYNTILEDLGLAARLRRGLRAAERDTLVSLCLRRNELDLVARMDLFRLAAELLREKFSLPSDARLSDERLVLNVTAVLLGADRSAARVSALPTGRRL